MVSIPVISKLGAFHELGRLLSAGLEVPGVIDFRWTCTLSSLANPVSSTSCLLLSIATAIGCAQLPPKRNRFLLVSGTFAAGQSPTSEPPSPRSRVCDVGGVNVNEWPRHTSYIRHALHLPSIKILSTPPHSLSIFRSINPRNHHHTSALPLVTLSSHSHRRTHIIRRTCRSRSFSTPTRPVPTLGRSPSSWKSSASNMRPSSSTCRPRLRRSPLLTQIPTGGKNLTSTPCEDG